MDFVIILYLREKKKEITVVSISQGKKYQLFNDFSFVSIYKKYHSTHVCKEYFL